MNFRLMKYNPLNLKGDETAAPEKPQFTELVISGGTMNKSPKWQLKFDLFRNHANCEDKINKCTMSNI